MIKKIVLVVLLISTIVIAQNETAELKVQFGGYINWSGYLDSRQTVSLREGHLLLYPSAPVYDKEGNDINDKANLNFLSIQTRINSKITGAEAFGSKVTGFIEGEFFGTSESDVNGLRLRHAYISFDWENSSLLFGQTWHPSFVPEAFAQVVSYNTGIPFQPFSRNPQIRFTQKFGSFKLMAALLTQRDFTSNGPNGFSSSYMRNSVIPEINFQAQYNSANILLGGGIGYKSLTPRIETSKKIKTDEKISTLTAVGFLKYKNSDFTFLAKGFYGENSTDLLTLGGYGVSSIDTITGKETYSSINVISFLTDIYYGKEFQVGLFAGYSENLGSDDKIVGKIYSRNENIEYLWRVTPRIQYNFNKITVATELEITSAAYGKLDEYAKVSNSEKVTNTRLVVSVFYFF
ncbi:MAG: hypothetical protein M0P71_04600 [Melioribacteraceae bacterium]|nr:hypothetical protein [Melioribacteraceae bacterium]